MAKKECAICKTPLGFLTTVYPTFDKQEICSNCGKQAKLNVFTAQKNTVDEIRMLINNNNVNPDVQSTIMKKINDNEPGFITNTTKRSINKLASYINNDEEIIYVFSGATTVPSVVSVTNERLLIAEDGPFNTHGITEIPLTKINSVSFSKGIMLSTLKVVNAYGEIQIKNIQNKIIDDVLKQIKLAMSLQSNSTGTTETKVNDFSNFDEIKKFKELLDSGIITEDEFNIKKKELLNL